jgi:hypothetical protein
MNRKLIRRLAVCSQPACPASVLVTGSCRCTSRRHRPLQRRYLITPVRISGVPAAGIGV